MAAVQAPACRPNADPPRQMDYTDDDEEDTDTDTAPPQTLDQLSDELERRADAAELLAQPGSGGRRSHAYQAGKVAGLRDAASAVRALAQRQADDDTPDRSDDVELVTDGGGVLQTPPADDLEYIWYVGDEVRTVGLWRREGAREHPIYQNTRGRAVWHSFETDDYQGTTPVRPTEAFWDAAAAIAGATDHEPEDEIDISDCDWFEREFLQEFHHVESPPETVEFLRYAAVRYQDDDGGSGTDLMTDGGLATLPDPATASKKTLIGQRVRVTSFETTREGTIIEVIDPDDTPAAQVGRGIRYETDGGEVILCYPDRPQWDVEVLPPSAGGDA